LLIFLEYALTSHLVGFTGSLRELKIKGVMGREKTPTYCHCRDFWQNAAREAWAGLGYPPADQGERTSFADL